MRALQSVFLVAGLLACSGPPPLPSEPTEVRPFGPYHHRTTGLVVPERVGSFERRGVTRYDPGGFSISARYESIEPQATLTFYHYPAGGSREHSALHDLEENFESAKHTGYRDTWRARLVHEQRVTFEINGIEVPGVHAVFRYPLSKQRVETVESHLWLFAVGNWYLKFQASSPREEARAAFEAQKRFIRSVEWVVPR